MKVYINTLQYKLVDKEQTSALFSRNKSIFKTISLNKTIQKKNPLSYSPFSIASFLGKRSREEFEEENEKLSSLLLKQNDNKVQSDKVLFSEMNSIPFEIENVKDLQNQIELVFDIPKKSQALFFSENGMPLDSETEKYDLKENTVILLLLRGNYVFFDYQGNTIMVKVNLKTDTVLQVQEKIIDKIKKSRWIPLPAPNISEIETNKIYVKSDRLFLGKEEKIKRSMKIQSTITSLEQRRKAQLEEIKKRRQEDQASKRKRSSIAETQRKIKQVLAVPRGYKKDEYDAEVEAEKEYWKAQYNSLVDSILTAKTSYSRVILPCGHYAQRNTVRLDGTIECPVCERVFDFNTEAHPFACPCCKSFYFY